MKSGNSPLEGVSKYRRSLSFFGRVVENFVRKMTRDRQRITTKERICIFDTPSFVLHSSFTFPPSEGLRGAFNSSPQTSPCPLHRWGIPNLLGDLQRRCLVQYHCLGRPLWGHKPNRKRCKCTFSFSCLLLK